MFEIVMGIDDFLIQLVKYWITLIWTDGTTVIPVDFRIYNIDEDDKTKNDHFRDMIDKGEERGFNPEFVLFDTWYASVKNLKAIRACLKIQPDLTIGIGLHLSLIHISEPTRRTPISYAVFCLKKK